MNRALSVRSKEQPSGAVAKSSGATARFKKSFGLGSLRSSVQPDISKKLYRVIKSEATIIGAYETAGKETASVASQLSDWGEETGDDAISDISDKLGVLLAEIAEQEDLFGQNLEESRNVLKVIRNTERSVQPTRDSKVKIADEIQKLKYKDANNGRISELEQELVRAEAQSLVAEAQLVNLTRQKFKEAYDLHLAAVIERAEKQVLLAKHARRLLNILDDTPIVPGDSHPTYEGTESARQILNEAEEDLRNWSPQYEEIQTQAEGLGNNAMPVPQHDSGSVVDDSYVGGESGGHQQTGTQLTEPTGVTLDGPFRSAESYQ